MDEKRFLYLAHTWISALGIGVASVAIVLGVGPMLDERNEPTSEPFLMYQGLNSNAATTAALSDGTYRTHSETTIADGTAIGSRLSREEVKKVMELHNKARSDVGVGPLKWSDKLAIYAQEWADHLASARCRMDHRPHSGKWQQKHGENLFMGTAGLYGVEDAVRAWQGERTLYKGGVLTSSNWYSSGHYTQIVWSGTEYVGCARLECNGNIIVVCNYDPPGNVWGQKPY